MTGKHIQIRVCFGHHKKYTSGAIWNNGLVKWDPQNGLLYILHFLFLITHYHLLTELSFCLSAQIYDIFLDLILMDDIDFPVAGKQVPDVFIYLALEGNALPYCFARVKSADLLAEKFKGPPKWIVFQEEKNINGLDNGVYPGQLLIKLGLGSEDACLEAKDEWDGAIETIENTQPFLCRFHLYQCRDLPSADSNGLCDPYLKIKFNGKEQESSRRNETLYPTYYETFDFHCDLSPEKEFMPMVMIVAISTLVICRACHLVTFNYHRSPSCYLTLILLRLNILDVHSSI